jgi:hypothetical protein
MKIITWKFIERKISGRTCSRRRCCAINHICRPYLSNTKSIIRLAARRDRGLGAQAIVGVFLPVYAIAGGWSNCGKIQDDFSAWLRDNNMLHVRPDPDNMKGNVQLVSTHTRVLLIWSDQKRRVHLLPHSACLGQGSPIFFLAPRLLYCTVLTLASHASPLGRTLAIAWVPVNCAKPSAWSRLETLASFESNQWTDWNESAETRPSPSTSHSYPSRTCRRTPLTTTN